MDVCRRVVRSSTVTPWRGTAKGDYGTKPDIADLKGKIRDCKRAVWHGSTQGGRLHGYLGYIKTKRPGLRPLHPNKDFIRLLLEPEGAAAERVAALVEQALPVFQAADHFRAVCRL